VDKDRPVQYSEDNQRSETARFSGTSPSDALFDDSSTKVGIDQAAVSGINGTAQVWVGDFAFPCEAGERLVLEDAHLLP
jgi:hypothetical protein